MSFGYQTTEAGPIVSDHVTAITPPGRPAHGQAFNALHEQTSYVPPALSGQPASDVQWTYDAEGRVDLLTIGGASVDFRYASASAANAGHLTSVVYPGHTTSFTYESTGAHQLQSVTADAETLTFGHDGPLPTSVAWSGTVAGTVSYGYDSFWQLSSIAAGGNTSRMSYDADGALDCVTSGTAPATPDSSCSTGLNVDLALEGTPQVWHARTRYPGNTGISNHVATDVALSRLGDLASATSTWAGTSTSGSLSFSYGYDSVGRIQTVTETSNTGTGNVVHGLVYTYDTQGRLTDVQRDGSTYEHYTYDANGNRLTAHAPGVADLATGQITTDARDRLTTYGTAQYTYNAQGQLATRFVPGVGTTTYTYDLLGALRSVSLPDGHVITYRVDAMGRRIERARDGMVTARWVYLDGLRPIAELDGTNAVRSVFVYGEGRVPSLMIRGGVTYRIITDHVGTVRRVINPATGAVVWSRDYDSFGNITSSAFAGGVTGDWIPFGFAGGLYDEDTGLVRFGARDYEPRTGTWNAVDPYYLAAGTNLYAYCYGDPVSRVDPTGHLPFLVWALVVAVVAGVGAAAGDAAGQSIGHTVSGDGTWFDPGRAIDAGVVATVATFLGLVTNEAVRDVGPTDAARFAPRTLSSSGGILAASGVVSSFAGGALGYFVPSPDRSEALGFGMPRPRRRRDSGHGTAGGGYMMCGPYLDGDHVNDSPYSYHADPPFHFGQ